MEPSNHEKFSVPWNSGTMERRTRDSGNHRLAKLRKRGIVHDGIVSLHWQQRGTAARRHCGPTAGRTPRHRWWITGRSSYWVRQRLAKKKLENSSSKSARAHPRMPTQPAARATHAAFLNQNYGISIRVMETQTVTENPGRTSPKNPSEAPMFY